MILNFLYDTLTWHLIGYGTGIALIWLQSRMYFVSFSFYWHNSVSHKHYTITPWLQHFIRFYQWINSTIWYQGHLTKWTAEHRMHHQYTDTDKDPVSPHRFTLQQLFTYEQRVGAARYVSPEEVEKYGDHSAEPNDPATLFYKRHQFQGVWISIIAWTIVLGPVGFVLAYLMQYYNQYSGIVIGDWVWHKFGYQHKEDKSQARNFIPFTFGEGLHSNHHTYPYKINKACRWFEIDFTYYILILCSWIGLIKFNTQLKELA